MQIHKLIIIAPFFLVHPAAPSHVIKHVPKPVKAITKPAPAPVPAPVPEQPAPAAPVQPPPQTFPVAPIGTYANPYAPFNCTSYVASRVKVPDTFGNANNWALAAAAEGVTVSTTPLIGSIAQTSRGVYGHVGLVAGISPGGTEVLIDEQNYDFMGSIREAWHNTSEFQYIYI